MSYVVAKILAFRQKTNSYNTQNFSFLLERKNRCVQISDPFHRYIILVYWSKYCSYGSNLQVNCVQYKSQCFHSQREVLESQTHISVKSHTRNILYICPHAKTKYLQMNKRSYKKICLN